MLCRDEQGPRLRLVQAHELVARRRGWLADRGEIEPEPVLHLHDLQATVDAVADPVVAIEAVWDGDTDGWFVVLFAITERSSRLHPSLDEVRLAAFRRGTDLRLLNGQVPPWPEAADATRLGQALAQTMNVPFHFQNADTPDIDQLRWWDTLS
jgi:hypothetical protein